MKNLFVLIFILLFPVSLMANTLDEERREWVLSNLMDDMLSCSVYYFIGGDALQKANQETHSQFYAVSKELMDRSKAIAFEINMKELVVETKWKQHLKSQTDIIENNYKNLSLLSDMFDDTCPHWVSNSFQDRINHWAYEWSKRFED